MKRRVKDTKIKLKNIYTCAVAAACLCAVLGMGVSADEYSFSGAAAAEFYPSQSYEDVYGAAYNYGGMNVSDFKLPDLPYGTESNTLSGSMEKVPLYGNKLTYGGNNAAVSYGIVSTGGMSIYEAAGAETSAPAVYKQTAYTSTSDMVRRDGSIGTVSIPSLDICMKVWEGETNESMAKGMAHYSSTSGWDGNVGMCGVRPDRA